MSFTNYFKRQREAFLDRTADAASWDNRLFSGTTYALWHESREIMRQYCWGLVLDAGSGRESWRRTILQTAHGYESIDIATRGNAQPTWIADITAMDIVPDARYDTVVCHQVLEHVRRPWRALAEFHRVMKPGGRLILSVPHLSRRHELPHDYFRYTQAGVLTLLEDASFESIEVRPYGGLLSFLHHQLAFLFPGLLGLVPVIGMLASAVNVPFSMGIPVLDSLLDRARLMPTGIVAVASKPA